MPDHSYFADLILQIAELLRGPYRPPEVRSAEGKHGSRLAIVSGPPLFIGGSSEGGIHKWINKSDWFEAIIALPEQQGALHASAALP